MSVAEGPRRSAPRLAEGIELIGEYQGSGFQEPKYIVVRADGQVIQLPYLLYLLASTVDGHRDPARLAARLSDELGRELAAEQVSYLLENRLRPAGVLAADPGAGQSVVPALRKPDPLLALKFRVGLVPERVSWVIAGVFLPMFVPLVVLVMLSAFVVLDVMLFLRGGFGQLKASALALVDHPELTLLVMVMMVVILMFHECGHVAACRYGGARPGSMGVGIYLVWPAMFSTVTDSYRLNRRGRLRTDLGGIYFNVVAIAAMILVYFTAPSPWLLITILLMHVETMRQFFPFVRLDGYYVLSDIIGVPDLFSRMWPVLRGAFRWRDPHPRVQELKPWVRRVVTLWVVLVVPAIVYFLLPFIILAPRVLPLVWDALARRGPAALDAAMAGNVAAALLGVFQMFFLVLPWAGAAMIFWMMGSQLVRAVRPHWHRRRQRYLARRRYIGRHRRTPTPGPRWPTHHPAP